MPNNPTYYALLEACAQPGCPVCRIVQAEVRRYLERLFFDSVNDIDLREKLRLSRGFCAPHANLLLNARLGDALGLAIIYQDVFTNVLRELPAPSPARAGAAGLLQRLGGRLTQVQQALRPRGRCPACVLHEADTRHALHVLGEALPDAALEQALQASEGLCLAHLQGALAQARDPAAFHILLEASRARLQALNVELAELIRKNDYRFRGEAFGAEGDAWLRAVRLAVGEDPQA